MLSHISITDHVDQAIGRIDIKFSGSEKEFCRLVCKYLNENGYRGALSFAMKKAKNYYMEMV
jgi:hypothetical protein